MSAVFEVIDPVRDPHIVKYDSRHVVLLDCVYNELCEFRRPSYVELQAFAAKYSFQVKKLVGELPSLREYNELKKRVDADMNFMVDGELIEGFVYEGTDGFMLKCKSKFYNVWKHCRQLTQGIGKGRLPRLDNEEPLVRVRHH